MNREDAALVLFTAKVALVSTGLLFVPGTLLAAWLARAKGQWTTLVEAFLSLPLVLPPTAIGLLLLELLRKDGPLGGLSLLFTPASVVLAAMVMSFPLMVRTARNTFEAIDPRWVLLARSLGSSRRRAFFQVVLPLALPGLLAGALLAFSRALGEFGATILIAGNIPGRTQTLSLALYQRAQMGDDAGGLRLAAFAVGISFLAVAVTEWLGRRKRGNAWT